MKATVVRGPGRDQWGDPVAGADQSFTLDGCSIEPRNLGTVDAETPDRNRDTTVELLFLYTRDPKAADVTATDTIDLDGRPYKVDGHPGDWRRGPFIGGGGHQIALTRKVG